MDKDSLAERLVKRSREERRAIAETIETDELSALHQEWRRRMAAALKQFPKARRER